MNLFVGPRSNLVPVDAAAPRVSPSPSIVDAAASSRPPVFAEPALAPDPRGDTGDAVDALNQHLLKPPLEAHYSVDDESRLLVIKIVNADTGEMLRQLPQETVVRLARTLTTRAAHLVDETV